MEPAQASPRHARPSSSKSKIVSSDVSNSIKRSTAQVKYAADGHPQERSMKRRRIERTIPDRMKQFDQLMAATDNTIGIGSSSLDNKSAQIKSSKSTVAVVPPRVEKRLRQWRKGPSQRYLEKLDRGLTQRMFVIGRTKGGAVEAPEETFTMVGTVGNVYEVTISKLPSCTCPDHLKGNHCKHLIYVMNRVLKAPDELQYQVALLSSELRDIFANAPPSPVDAAKTDDQESGKRKPIEGDCPICFTDFDPENNQIVWCRAACGNNIHKTCFQKWAASSRGQATCVYCRAPWQAGSAIEGLKEGEVNSEGYVNVAEQYGLSGERDYSSYNQFWVDRHFGRPRYWR